MSQPCLMLALLSDWRLMSRTAALTSRALALLAAGALTVAAIAPTSADAAGAPTRPTLHLRTTKTHHVVAPAHTRPGIAHLSNSGEAEVIVVEAKHAKQGNARQVASGLNAKSPGALIKNYRVIAVVENAMGVYTRLTSGSYFLADGYISHFKASDIDTMTVIGQRFDARPPVSRKAYVTSGRSLRLPAAVAKSGWLHVRNASSSLSNFFIEAVTAKTTQQQLSDLVAHPSIRKLNKVVGAGSRGFSVFGPDSSTWIPYRGPAGRYVAVLYAYVGSKTMLHHGQVRVLTLK